MKILHSPVNVAGIGGFLSSYQRTKGFTSDFLVFKDDNPFFQNHDKCLNLNRYWKYSKKLVLWYNFVRCLLKYDVFHFYFGQTLLPNNIDLPILRFFKKKIFMTCCGSDFRLVEVERKRNPYSSLLKIGLNDPKFDESKKKMLKDQAKWVHLFFAPRNLYASVSAIVDADQINSDIWLHNLSFDSSLLVDKLTINSREIPLIVHMPTNRDIKGSRYIQAAIETIRKLGVKFDYQEITGVSHEEAIRIIKNSDILIDQMLLGGIGSTAFEAMGLGKTVVSYIIEDVRREFYPDCPVFNATIDNLPERLAEIISDKELRIALGKKGVEFVTDNLDKNDINTKLLELYQTTCA